MSLRFEPVTAPSLCLNSCSQHGQCETKLEQRKLPYCSCFEGFIGPDCGLPVKVIEKDEPEKVTLLQGTSLIFQVQMSDEHAFLRVTDLSGELHVYTITVNNKVL